MKSRLYKDLWSEAYKGQAEAGKEVQKWEKSIEVTKNDLENQESTPGLLGPVVDFFYGESALEDDLAWKQTQYARAKKNFETLANETKYYEDLFLSELKNYNKYETEYDKLVGNSSKGGSRGGSGGASGSGGSGSGGSGSGKGTTKELKDKFKEEYNILKKAHERALISEELYYHELAKLRNEYFEEGSEEWEEYSDDILEYYTDMLSDAKAEAYTQVQEVQQMQEGLFQKLQEGTKTYRQFSITEKGKETTYTKLADVGIDNRSLEQYNNLIDRLFEKQRDLPKDFMENLSGMSVDEGISFLTALLSASDEELNNYMSQLERNEKLAAEISGKIASVEMEETAQEIVNQFSQVSEDFFAIGEESAKVYGEGFMNELDNVYNQVREQVLSILPDLELASNVTGATVSGMSNAGNTSNKYDNSRHTSVTINNHSSSGISAFAERLGLEKLMDKLSMQGVL